MNFLAPFAKAAVVPVVGLVLLALSYFGITPEMTVEQVITHIVGFLLTTIAVYQIPNKK